MSSNETRLYYDHRKGHFVRRRNRSVGYNGTYMRYPHAARKRYSVNLGMVIVVIFLVGLGSISWLSWFFR